MTNIQWKRGLWRLGWVLWTMTAVPTIYIAHQESIEPGYQWKEVKPPEGFVLDRPKKQYLDDQGNPNP
ncbi:MAG: hypothetical protein HY313_11590 [Acidobacteria bacterium]|nr:hypothetical protein [Acidobacteriota bacterium]